MRLRGRVLYRYPATPVITEIMERLRRGEEIPPQLGYKLAVACLKNWYGRHPLFSSCEECFFRDVCAYPRDPGWFKRRGIVRG